MSRKLQRIAIANITRQIQFKGQNVIFGNTLTEKVTLEQIAKQIGFAASANTGDHLYLTIPHKGDDFLQIAISFYFHNPTSIENLLVLSCYFSTGIIHQCERKIKGFVKMFTDKSANISMESSEILLKAHLISALPEASASPAKSPHPAQLSPTSEWKEQKWPAGDSDKSSATTGLGDTIPPDG